MGSPLGPRFPLGLVGLRVEQEEGQASGGLLF